MAKHVLSRDGKSGVILSFPGFLNPFQVHGAPKAVSEKATQR